MKRRIAIILLLLAGGAVVNVAVAWGVQLIPQTRPSQPFLGHDLYGNETLGIYYRGFGFERVHCPSTPFIPTTERRDHFDRNRPRFEWSVNRQDEGQLRLVEEARGWPMKSLYLCLEIGTGRLLGAGAWNNDSTLTGRLPQYTFPYVPILPGFIINTLFYALLLWLLIFAPFTVRRILRRKRGLCEKCAYPIGVSPVCTECGAAVPRKLEA